MTEGPEASSDLQGQLSGSAAAAAAIRDDYRVRLRKQRLDGRGHAEDGQSECCEDQKLIHNCLTSRGRWLFHDRNPRLRFLCCHACGKLDVTPITGFLYVLGNTTNIWARQSGGDTMPNLNAPSQTTFLASLAIAILAWIAYFASMPYIGEHSSALLTVAFAWLASGCVYPD